MTRSKVWLSYLPDVFELSHIELRSTLRKQVWNAAVDFPYKKVVPFLTNCLRASLSHFEPLFIFLCCCSEPKCRWRNTSVHFVRGRPRSPVRGLVSSKHMLYFRYGAPPTRSLRRQKANDSLSHCTFGECWAGDTHCVATRALVVHRSSLACAGSTEGHESENYLMTDLRSTAQCWLQSRRCAANDHHAW